MKKTSAVPRALVEKHDAEQHDQVGVAVDHRIEESTERALPGSQAGERAVEEVEQASHREECRRQPKPALEEGVTGEHAQAEPKHGELVRAHASPEEEPRDRVGHAVQALLVVAQHGVPVPLTGLTPCGARPSSAASRAATALTGEAS